ncbi:MAG: arginine--tRNA ligase [Candidatus Micrarchaeota archaeon]
MAYAYTKAKEEIVEAVYSACEKLGYAVSEDEVSRAIGEAKPEFGDLTCTLAFDLAKKMKRNPKEIADNLAKEIGKLKFTEKVSTVGPYVNFTLGSAFAKESVGEILKMKKEYGSGKKAKKKVIIEFPSVNPNKPWHVGHLRNAVLGDSVARVLEFSGLQVERLDYINNLGLQVAQSVWGYLNMNTKNSLPEGGYGGTSNLGGAPPGFGKKFDHWLGEQYVEVAKKFENKENEKEVRALMKEMEEGKGKNVEKAREVAMKCVLAQYETAFRLNIFHDAMIWESEVVSGKLFESALAEMEKKGIIKRESEGKNAGCVVVKLEQLEEFKDMENPDKIIVRSDGVIAYTGKDVAFQMWKFGLLPYKFKYASALKQANGKMLYSSASSGKAMNFGKAELVVNVIGVEQAYPQRMIGVVLKLMGYEKEAENSVHLAYEHAWLPDAKFSGREGTWLGYSADEVIEEAVKRARDEIKARFEGMDEEEKDAIAEIVGVGAIRFSFVRTSPEKKIVFKWEEALNFEGDSAPYVQYAHARASRILEKAGKKEKPKLEILENAEEKMLIRRLSLFPKIVAQAAREYRAHYVADYALDVASSFSKFYNASPVLKSEGDVREARVALVEATRIVLANSLALLGIEAPERM